MYVFVHPNIVAARSHTNLRRAGPCAGSHQPWGVKEKVWGSESRGGYALGFAGVPLSFAALPQSGPVNRGEVKAGVWENLAPPGRASKMLHLRKKNLHVRVCVCVWGVWGDLGCPFHLMGFGATPRGQNTLGSQAFLLSGLRNPCTIHGKYLGNL